MSAQAIDREDVKEWLRRDVAQEIEEDRGEEITALHVSDSYRGLLAWFAKHYVEADPEQLIFADGSSDGGIDVASVISLEHETQIDIYQISTPKLERIAEGRVVLLARQKLGDDVRTLRNSVTGEAKKLKNLNPTAHDVLRQINRAREIAATTDGVPVTIAIHPLSLNEAHPDARRELDDLANTASREWSTDQERWIVHPVKDVNDLYALYQRKRPQDQSPAELRLRIFGELCADHPQRGPFLVFIQAAGLVEAYEKYGAGLMDSNLRFSLGRTEVNKLIESELLRVGRVKWFHEKNNGLVITCNSCNKSGDDQIRLVSPQIVNGGQTIHSIATVLSDLEVTPIEKRTPDEQRLIDDVKSNLRLSARIVVVSGAGATRLDEIAIASNTQNKLSERTMRSTTLEMRDLRLSLAAASNPWFVVTKDGEWKALSAAKSLFQSKTGNRIPRDFQREGRACTVENSDLGVALLAFYGFVEEAKPSRVFKPRYFNNLYGWRPRKGAWQSLASKRLEWRGPAYDDVFEAGQPASAHWLLSYFVWDYWKTYTYPESRQLIMAFEEAGVREPAFRERWFKKTGWDVSDDATAELLAKSDTCYWVEQIAKSAYLVLAYQTMRVLVRTFGELTIETCQRILQLRQFRELCQGQPTTRLGDFRTASLIDGPLNTIGQICRYSCELLWQSQEQRIRAMASRQQVLLTPEWVTRLSDQVDFVCERIGKQAFRDSRQLEHQDDRTLGDLTLRELLEGTSKEA